jgi:cysteine desulfuration protein SufE
MPAEVQKMPEKLAETLDAIALVPDRADRIQLLIDIASRYREVPPAIATRPFPEESRVPACESEAYVFPEERPDGTLDFHFAVENPQGISAKAMAVSLVPMVARNRAAGIEDLHEWLAPLLAPGTLPETSRAVLLLALRFGGRRDRDATELLARCGDFLEQARENPRLRFETGTEPALEMWWDALDADFRRHLCGEARVPAAVAGLAAEEVPPIARHLISWVYEELTQVRIVFMPPSHPLS